MRTLMKVILVALLSLSLIGCRGASAETAPAEEPEHEGPNYNDVRLFLEEDLTDQIQYEHVDMVCWDFAEKLQQNAHKAGLDCAIVTLAWGNSDISHVINAFQTSDKGLIWVDVTGSRNPSVKGYDREIEPKVAGDTFLYEEIGGLLPMTVTLREVSYSW